MFFSPLPPRPLAVFLTLCSLLATPVVADDPKPDPAATREYVVAVGLQEKGLFAQAARRWQQFIKDYPTDPRLPNAYHHLGEAQLREKQFPEAVTTFRTLLEKFPKFESLDAAQLNLGLALYNVGLGSKKGEDLKLAAEAFAKVVSGFPKSKHAPSALYYQGECLYQQNDLTGAIAVHQRAITAYPMTELMPDLLYALGTTQQELGRHPDATATFKSFLDKFPKDRLAAECRLRHGQGLFQQGKITEAERLFAQMAVEANFPHADFALLQQARCQYELKQLGQAAALYQAVPKKFPKSRYAGAALLGAGKCWFQTGKLPEAQAAFARAVDPAYQEAPEAGYWLVQALLRLGKPEDALAQADRSLTAHPKSAFVPELTFVRLSAMAELPARRKESVSLFADFAKAHATHELAPRALYMAALASLKVEDFAATQKHAEQFLADPKLAMHSLRPEVVFLAAEGYLQDGQPNLARAEELYRRLLADHPRHEHAPQSRLRIGLCRYLAKRYDDAVTFLTQAAPELKAPAEQAEAQFLIGRSHAGAGRPEQAVASLQKALETKPGWERSDEVLLALAAALRRQKKLPEAAAPLERLVKEYPKSSLRPQALYQLGELAYEQKKYDETALHYGQLVSEFPKSDLAAPAQHGTGLAWFAKGDYARAAEAFTKQLDSYGTGDLVPRGRLMRGLAHQRLRQFESAVKDLAAFLGSPKIVEKDRLDARYALGFCQAGLGRHEEAAATLAALLKDKPDYEQADKAIYEMAFALQQAKKDREAAEAFTQLTTRFPKSPLAAEAGFRAGEQHAAAGRWTEAIPAYRSGLERAKEPGLREKLQYRLGWALYQKGDLPDAVTLLREQLKEHPKGELAIDGAYLAGDCLFKRDSFAEALPLFDQVIGSGNKSYAARARYRGAASQAGLKQWADSEKRYAELIKLFPDFELIHEARYGVGWALQNQEKFAEARAIYEQVIKQTQTEAAAKSRFMIGECAFREKKYQEAAEHFLEAALGYTYPEWQALGYFEAGRCFIELKDNDKAIDLLETVVKKYPKHARAKDASQLIADLKKK